MADERRLEQAKKVYESLCQMLDNHEWTYKRNDESLIVECGVRGKDLPMDLNIHVDAERALVLVISHLPFVTQVDKRVDMILGVSAVNKHIVDGCFDFDIQDGHIFFRMTNSFLESVIGEDLLAYMVFCSCQTIDEYNEKFMLLSRGLISIDTFLKAVTN